MVDFTYRRAADEKQAVSFDFTDFMTKLGVGDLSFAVRADPGMDITLVSNTTEKVDFIVTGGRVGRVYTLDIRGLATNGVAQTQTSIHRIVQPGSEFDRVLSSTGDVIDGGDSQERPQWGDIDGGGAVQLVPGQVIDGGFSSSGGGTGPVDTRPKFGVALAAAFADPAHLLAFLSPIPGSAAGSHVGTFSLTTTPLNYGWVAVQDAQALTFTDPSGFPGGWNGAGLVGANLNGGPAQSNVSVSFTDTSGTTWQFFRTDFPNPCPTATTWAIA